MIRIDLKRYRREIIGAVIVLLILIGEYQSLNILLLIQVSR